MDVENQRHVVSIDVLIGEQDREGHQLSLKKNRLTILVGCNNKYPSQVSLRKNLAPSIDSLRRISGTETGTGKYYFNRKNKKQKKMTDGGLTQRKPINGVTTSLCRGRQISKSYRIHTIDYIEQNDKKEQNKKYENNLISLTKKKDNFTEICKKRIKKKSIINQSDFTEFNVNLKHRKEKQGITVNLKHRKFNKVKTEFEEDNVNTRPVEPEDKKNLMSERKLHQENLFKKIQFRKNKMKNLISSHSQRETVLMKIENDKISTHEEDNNLRVTQKKSKEKHQNNFNDYLDFLERKKNQIVQSKGKRFRNVSEQQSLVMKSKLIKETICLKIDKDSIQTKQNTKPTKMQEIISSQKAEIQTKTILKQSPCQPKGLLGSQLECSTIQQINQSSFLSQTGRKQIITTTAFQMLDTNNPHALQHPREAQNVKSSIQVEESPKKKKRKKQSKMSIICRSDIKQKFPQRFFG